MTVWAAHAPNYDYSNVDFYEENTVVDAEGDLAANTLLDYQHEDQAVVEEEARALHHTVQEIYKKQRIFHLILLLGEPGCSHNRFLQSPRRPLLGPRRSGRSATETA